jgi:hypothetical protein
MRLAGFFSTPTYDKINNGMNQKIYTLPAILFLFILVFLILWQKEKAEPENTLDNLIHIDYPATGTLIKSPLTVRGKARGSWYFEATFPIALVDWDGRIIAQSYATAEDEWMTDNFVPFQGTIEFENPSFETDFSKRGTLIFQKNNPSGLSEYDKALELSVYFE